MKPLTLLFLSDDIDDLAFAVKANPSFTEIDVNHVEVTEEPKDAAVDIRKRVEMRVNQRANRAGGSKSSKNAKRA